jgi:probable rRNA maturation factor
MTSVDVDLGAPGEEADVVVGPTLLQGAIRVADGRWAPFGPAAIADLVLSAVAGSMIAPDGSASCDLLFTDDGEIEGLNGRFRRKPQPTNVLAFPSGEQPVRGQPAFLGGVALSFDTCRREADERGITLTAHASHLTLHGVLHLLGYDHEDADEREEMERVEVSILAGLGIDNPYEGS